MCLLLFAVDTDPVYHLVLAANRDEAYARPTAPAAPWADAPGVVAGRDLEGGGTWLGVAPGGRWAALTNIRDLPAHRDGARSRGHLVSDYLTRGVPPSDYAAETHRQRGATNPFNLVLGDRTETWYVSTRRETPERLAPGLYGLSNDVLDTPWPKVVRGRVAFEAALAEAPLDADRLLTLLHDPTPAADGDLPDTGVGLDLERVLSPLFIRSETYGTRASTVLLLDRDGGGTFVERTWGPGGTLGATRRYTLAGGSPSNSPRNRTASASAASGDVASA